MAERDDTSASRKTARSLALTHRQHKATRRARPEQRSEQRGEKRASAHVTTPRAREQSPSAPINSVDARRQKTSHKPSLVNPTTAPLPLTPQRPPAVRPTRRVSGSPAPARPRKVTQTPAQKLQKLAQGKASSAPAAPKAHYAPKAPAAKTPKAATVTTATPARAPRPRAALSRKAAADASDITTGAMAGDEIALPVITIVGQDDAESAPAVSDTPTLGEQEPGAQDFAASLLAPEAAPPEPISEAPIAETEAPIPTADLITSTETLSEAAESAQHAAPPTEAESVSDAEPVATTRKMPTLAVMAALSQRAEPAQVESGNLAGAEEWAGEQITQPRLRAIRPTVPLTAQVEEDRFDPAALDVQDVLEAAPTEEARAEAISAPDDIVRDDVLAGAVWPAAPNMATAPDEPVSESAPVSAEPEPPARHSAGTSVRQGGQGGHGMWWPLATWRRAAPETRSVAAVSPLAQVANDGAETTAPRFSLRRSAPTQSAPDARDRQSRRQEDRETKGEAKGEAWRWMDDTRFAGRASKTPEVGFSRRAQTTGARLRARAMRSPRAIVLSWVAGGHVAVACVAALIAVIAALRSSAGPDALAVFNWTLTLALIAGVGAAVGYACAQMTRPRLATAALVLSQLGALAWALQLLGPRAALLALAPASAALALRGAGRLSAVVTALGWMTLFIVYEALTLAGALSPALSLNAAVAAVVDVALLLIGLWLAVSILSSLYVSRLNVVARGRAVEHAALLTEAQLDRLRTQTEDDADALRRTLREALRGEQPERVYARGALSVVADEVNKVADRLVDLGYDRTERKRLESATRRLTRVIERAWLGLSWSWPDATGTMLDDLLALLRTPPPPDTPDLLDDTTPTGQVVAPHLFRGWQASQTDLSALRAQPSQPDAPSGSGAPGSPSAPSMPSLPSLWPSDPGLGLTDPLALPPSPRWRSPDALLDTPLDHRPGAPDR